MTKVFVNLSKLLFPLSAAIPSQSQLILNIFFVELQHRMNQQRQQRFGSYDSNWWICCKVG